MSVFEDVMKAKDYVHAGNKTIQLKFMMLGRIQSDIMSHLSIYLTKHRAIGEFLLKLRRAGKKVIKLICLLSFQMILWVDVPSFK